MAKKSMVLSKARFTVLLAFALMVLVAFALSNWVVSQNQYPSQISLNSNEIVPGTFPVSSCVVPIYNIHSNMVGTTGLSTFNVSGVTDYLINPGNNGSINYTVYVSNSIVPSNAAVVNAADINASNIVHLYHLSSNNQTVGTTYDINISSDPDSEILVGNSNYSINVTIAVASNATEGTYWMSLGPGFCFSGPVALLTIGNQPYNGSVKESLFRTP